jgi:hypothetical protein
LIHTYLHVHVLFDFDGKTRIAVASKMPPLVPSASLTYLLISSACLHDT